MPLPSVIDVIPYLTRRWRPDFNCWDFIRELYAKEFNIQLEPHEITVASAIREANLAFLREATKPDWLVTGAPAFGDVAIFGKRGIRYHAGFILTPATVLHLPENMPSNVALIRKLRMSFDSLTFYRHVKIRHS